MKGRKLVWALAVVIGAALLSYGVDRATAGSRRIRLHRAALKSTPVSADRLKIAAYNIAHGRGPHSDNFGGGGRQKRSERLAEIAQLIKKHDPDLVVLNEVDFDSLWSYRVNQAERIAQLAGYPYRVEQRNLDLGVFWILGLRFGNAILSKYPLSSCHFIQYPPYSKLETWLAGQKSGVVCTVESTPPFDITAVHLSHRSESLRVRSAEQLLALQRKSPRPGVLAGDFNSTRANFPRARKDPSGRTAIGVLASSGLWSIPPEQAPKDEQLTFSSRAPRAVIDWIAAPSAWCVHRHTPLLSLLSDHRPVLSELSVKRCDFAHP